MKVWISLFCLVVVFFKWDEINHLIDKSFGTSQQKQAGYTSAGQVILYSTTWCGYCKKTRNLLIKNGIPFTEYDVEKSPIGKQQYNAIGGGGVPILKINGTIVRGYNKDKILKLAK